MFVQGAERDYRMLLEPIGFKIETVAGIGPPPLCLADDLLRGLRASVPEAILVPILPLLLPTVWLAKINPRVPFSVYVKAVKPAGVSD